MKKAMLCIIFSLLLFFCACSNGEPALNSKNPAEPSGELEVENPAEPSGELEVEYPLLSIYTVEEYDQFLTEKSCKQKFLSSSILQQIGTFEKIIILSNVKAGDYSHCMYDLRDTSGYKLRLYVRVGNSQEDTGKAVSEEQVDPHDLRKLNDKSSGKYVYNGCKYWYINGELLSIQWKNGAYLFELCGDSMLNDYPYPENKDTLLGSMLSADTSSAAAALLHEFLPE